MPETADEGENDVVGGALAGLAASKTGVVSAATDP